MVAFVYVFFTGSSGGLNDCTGIHHWLCLWYRSSIYKHATFWL